MVLVGAVVMGTECYLFGSSKSHEMFLVKDFLSMLELMLLSFGKLAHTHHFTVFYCEIGVVGK